MPAMGEPINQGGGHGLVAEDLGPFGERQVGGDDQRHALAQGRAELEQQLGARFGERYEPELVDSARFFPLRTR